VQRVIVSADYVCDEGFESHLAFNRRLFHDGVRIRPHNLKPHLPSHRLAHTGPPVVDPNIPDDDSPWVPYTALPPQHPAPTPLISDFLHMDRLTEEGLDVHEHFDDELPSDSSLDNPPSNEPQLHITPPITDDDEAEEGHPDVADDDSDSDSDDDSVALNDTDETADESDEIDDEHDQQPPPAAQRTRLGRAVNLPERFRDPKPAALRKARKQQHAAVHRMLRVQDQYLPAALFSEVASVAAEVLPDLPPGSSGESPSMFIPEPQGLYRVLREPPSVKDAWVGAFEKEIRGLVKGQKAVEICPIDEGKSSVPVREIFKCKLDQNGMIDKLKCRVVFRGDLYDPQDPMDSWNPHATWPSLRLFLALCARYRIFPSQSDFVMAYLQVPMKERVFIKFPAYWADVLPNDLKPYCGTDLLLKKALYGYTYSGKFLFEEQADFFRSFGLRQTVIPALWVQHFDGGGVLMVLHYSDDLLAASYPTHHHHAFIIALQKKFIVEHSNQASWYLQSRIRQDKFGNIYLDQQQYSKSIVARYLKLYDAEPSAEDLEKYKRPLPVTFKWTKAHRSVNEKALKILEEEFGIRFIEATGSLNYLSNTFIRGLFATRKMCKFMHLPGKQHFKAMLHFLNHIRCYPPGALVFYHEANHSPLAQLSWLMLIRRLSSSPTHRMLIVMSSVPLVVSSVSFMAVWLSSPPSFRIPSLEAAPSPSPTHCVLVVFLLGISNKLSATLSTTTMPGL
jgi:Reverse transcriptase (RNA-dependent DNA polymerase)